MDILLSMWFNLLLANITILLCFFFFFFDRFCTIAVEIENASLKLLLAILTGDPTTVENGVIETLPVVTDKTIKDLSK